MKNVITLIIFGFFSTLISAQETIDIELKGPGAGCIKTETVTKTVIGSSGGYNFSGVSLTISYSGTQWELNVIGLGINFTNSSTQIPYPPCLSAGGWVDAENQTICFDQIIELSGDGCSNALPIELINFTVDQSQNNVTLTWETASEIYDNYFEIERSEDGNSFMKIGQLAAQGNSLNRNKYSFQNDQIKKGRYYYILKQVDFDGNFEYHEVVSILISSTDEQLEVVPTVTSDFVKIRIPFNLEDKTLEIFSMSGQKIKTYLISKEQTEIDLNLSQLSQGVYFFKCDFREKFLTSQVVKN